MGAMDLDLRQLRYFVTVAHELSFTSAAERLHMTQPALSRQISALEHDLGARLFDRDRRGTALTAAGRQLLEDAIPLLAASTAVERRTRLAGRGAARFTIGFMPGVPSTPIVKEFAARAPQVTVDVVYTSIADQLDFLVDGRVDVCFVRLPLGDDEFTTLDLFPEPQVVAVPVGHPVAGQPAVEINQVSGLPLLQDRGEVPEWLGPLADTTPQAARDRRRRPTVEEQLERVALGAGLFVLPAGIAGFYRRSDIGYVPLTDVAPRMVALAYGSHRTMPEIEEFAKLSIAMLGGGG
jgi:DNA-binding transcriptional LysR family regulator